MSSANYLLFGAAVLRITSTPQAPFGGNGVGCLIFLQFLEKKRLFFKFFLFFFSYLKVLLVNGGQNLISDSVTPPCASDFS